MKNYIATTIAATGLIIFVFGMQCTAQSARRLVADIPFDFYVGEEKLSSGRYEFEAINRHANSGAVVIRPMIKSERSSMIVATMSETAKPGVEPVLIFNRYGTDHFLARIKVGTDEVSYRFRKTSSEERLAKDKPFEPVTIRQTATAGR